MKKGKKRQKKDKQAKKNKPQLVAFHEVDVSSRYEDVYEDFRPDHLAEWEQQEHEFFFRSQNGIDLRIAVLGERLFRVRYRCRGPWETAPSYAIDPIFEARPPADLEILEFQSHLEIRTTQVICRIDRKRLKVHFFSAAGEQLLSDRKGFQARSTILTGLSDLRVEKKLPKATSYFGLGDKSGPVRLNGQAYENWNTDSFAYDNETDPLYKTIPFTVGHRHGNWFGLFLDNTYRTFFDFGSKKKKRFRFGAKGGELDYYFFTGANSNEVARTYARLTGRPELPAMWTLGFHQCRWSYFPENRVREVATEFRKRKIPCDAIYLDIDYMDGYRCFTWDKSHFPEPKKMIADLAEDGFRTVVMIDPGLKVDPEYEVYREGLEKDYYCRRSDGELMLGPVWPDNCVFPDFLREDVRHWWGQLYRELYVDQGVAGFWNDMNEPAVFKINHKTFPNHVLHEHHGRMTNHRRAHNVYGQQMVRATRDGLADLRPEHRPLVITRATYAGGQRYSFAWTGDNIASWEHLKLASVQCQRLSLCGFSLNGSDIGGFMGVPTPELMVRWVQLAVFHPFFRIHSMGNNVDGAAGPESDSIREAEKVNRLDQEPWAFGAEAEEQMRRAIEMRYRLLPYFYTLCQQLAEDGTPVLRSLMLEDPDDPRLADHEEAFFAGDHLLVFPVTEPGKQTLDLPLPAGNWYDYETGRRISGGSVQHKTSLEHIPVIARAGAVIPHYPLRQYTDEAPPDQLILRAYYGRDPEISRLYEDAGDGYAYRNGAYLDRTFVQEGNEENWTLRQQRKGNYEEPYAMCSLSLYGLPFKPEMVEVDGLPVGFDWDAKKICLQLEFPTAFREVVVKN